MNYENDSCAVKVAEVREYCLSHPDEKGVLELSADVENVLGALAQVDGQRDSAAVHYENACGYVMKMKDRSKAPMYCINLADILRQVGKAPEAAQWLRRALSLLDSLGTKDLDCAINTQLGQVYSDLRHTSMADKYFEAAEVCCEKESFDEYFLVNAPGLPRGADLALSPSMVKLKPDSIVNVDYIQSIGAKNQSCTLVEPFCNFRLYFSRRSAANFKKE